MTAAAISDVTKWYRRTPALRVVSARWGTGIHVILGPNGAGKSTLLRLLARLERPTTGTVSVLGVSGSDRAGELRGRMGYLPQAPPMPAHIRVRQMVDYVCRLRGIASDRAEEATETALHLADIHELASRKVRTLSGGQRQRCAIAAALVGYPELVLLDEPTAGLDPAQRVRFRRALSSFGETVIMSTHLVEDIPSDAESVLVLREGRIVFLGSPTQLEALTGNSKAGDISAMEAGYMELMGRS